MLTFLFYPMSFTNSDICKRRTFNTKLKTGLQTLNSVIDDRFILCFCLPAKLHKRNHSPNW